MAHQIVQMIEEIKKCEAAGATAACIMQIYVYIDTLAYINMPVGQQINTKKDFIGWVDKYFKADESQLYQYRGIDIYGARCALLHAYSSDAEYHQKHPETIRFGYTDGGKHFFKLDENPNFAIIGAASFINDFILGVLDFIRDLESCIANPDEKLVLDERLNKILQILPFS